MNVLLQNCENKTHYKLEINRRNGKSFCKLQGFETVLLYTFKSFAEKQSPYLFSLLLLLINFTLMFPSCIWHIFEKLIGF